MFLIIGLQYLYQSTKHIFQMYSLRRTKNRDASMKSRSNLSMKVDDPNPKDNQSQQSDYHISEYES